MNIGEKKKKNVAENRITRVLRRNITRLYLTIIMMLFVYPILIFFAQLTVSDEHFVYMPITFPLIVWGLGIMFISGFLMLFINVARGTLMLGYCLVSLVLLSVILALLGGVRFPPTSSLYHHPYAYHIVQNSSGSAYYIHHLFRCDSLSIHCEILTDNEQFSYRNSSHLKFDNEMNAIMWLGSDDSVIYTHQLD